MTKNDDEIDESGKRDHDHHLVVVMEVGERRWKLVDMLKDWLDDAHDRIERMESGYGDYV